MAIKTDTTKLQKAYADYADAIDKQKKAELAEIDVNRKETEQQKQSALQQAYIERERAAYRQGQTDRAAGITGGMSISEEISRNNSYNNNRTNIALAAEKANTGYDISAKKAEASAYASKASNELAKQTALHSIEQSDTSDTREIYNAFLSGNYIPADTKEAKEMARSLGVDLKDIQAYVNYMKNNQ